MRLRRLDLIRFGHFTDRSFDLTAGESDIHIIFGPNEAGKSTALAAIEDLLFSMPTRSPYNFLHDYKSMRIGAVLEKDGSVLEVHRRKGNKDTLLDADDVPMSGGEAGLKPFLESADRAFFERMFSLDHARLEEGGREILKASDEVGQMLFAAGAGIDGLRDRLNKLDEEADNLWGFRRAAKRLYTQAEDRLNAAQRELREHTLTAKHWNDLRRAYEAAEKRCSEIEADIQKKSADGKRLSRIRRVYPYVREKNELEQEIEALGTVIALPEQASETLRRAEQDESVASGSIDTVAAQLERARKALEDLSYDEALVGRAADVRALNERRIEIRREKADLPKRRTELEAAERELTALARELEWQDESVDNLVDRIPARSLVKTVAALLGKRGELAAAVANGSKELEEAEAEVLRLQERLDGTGDLPDISNLNAASKAVREMGDVVERALSGEQRVRDATSRVESLLTLLNPSVRSETDIVEMKVPSEADVQVQRDEIRDSEQRQRETDREIEGAEAELGTARTKLEQTAHSERAIAESAIAESRDQRNALWGLVRRKHIEGGAITEQEHSTYGEELQDLPSSFEAKMQVADDMADERFDTAEASGRLAEMSRSIELREEQIEQLRKKAGKLKDEREALDGRWVSMWANARLEPLSPASMLEWLKGRRELLGAIESRTIESSASTKSDMEVQTAKESLLTEMSALGVERESLEGSHLRVVIERASELQQQYASEKGEQNQLRGSLADAKDESERRRRDVRRADEAWTAWESEWSTALANLGLAANLNPAAVEAQTDVIDQMREKDSRIHNLRHERIAKIERDIADFDEVTRELVQVVAQDLAELPADDAALNLAERLEEAERVRDLQEGKRSDVEDREQQIAELEEARDTARQSLRHLHDTAGTESVDALKLAIENSDQDRDHRSKLSATLESLKNGSDGHAVADIERECAAINVDEIAAVEETNAAELKDLDERRAEAVDVRSQARTAFEAVGGGDAAAVAEAARQEALAEMGEVAVRYARVRASSILLKWAIDRFLREKQTPLLTRAGELFATVTGGSFSGLRIDYDDDETQLIGLRPGGESVEVAGMSSGTADQLYLALRVASVEDYLDRAGGLPFVADDLFINFDDDRATAGFEVLGQLARKTQVLFFTHHRHLVDVALRTLGGSVNVVTL